ncbi:MAG: hypothetical protein HOQ11_15385 [Gemmatimonadaceae bacterium]|nr:hypothetical protein [Gemmatimonadaceae bacterium]NUQ91733.1 hypothetical protein [Gemmatimonadaceae bacterium]NUR19360.1 hypothetical protein [Gemmatimonadaceae bacterium]NUS98784.1 hypothetical protein [Gemmatimonadaceae bacterium]
MPTLASRIAALAANTTDTIVALAEAAWPRSMSSREIDRLASDGYEAGSVHEMYFLLSFERPGWERMLGELQRAGFVVRDGGPLGPFVTVRTAVRLRAFELSLVGNRLDRMLAKYDGFSTLIGPAAARTVQPQPLERRLVAG